MTFDPRQLRAALGAVEGWSQPSTLAGTGAHHGYRRVELVTAGRRSPASEPWWSVLDTFSPVWAAWLSWIDPGGFIRPHIDAGPYRERWQVPIIPGDLNGHLTTEGVPFLVRHWLPHHVTNTADRPRVHLVVDRDVIVDPRPEPFQLLEI